MLGRVLHIALGPVRQHRQDLQVMRGRRGLSDRVHDDGGVVLLRQRLLQVAVLGMQLHDRVLSMLHPGKAVVRLRQLPLPAVSFLAIDRSSRRT